MWEEIISKYHLNGSMTKKYRRAMNEAIVQFARVKDIYMDVALMENVSFQICKFFPKEATVYFFLRNSMRKFNFKKNHSQTNYIMNNGKGYSGSLYNLYHCKRSYDIKEQKERLQDELDQADVDVPEPTGRFTVLKVRHASNRTFPI